MSVKELIARTKAGEKWVPVEPATLTDTTVARFFVKTSDEAHHAGYELETIVAQMAPGQLLEVVVRRAVAAPKAQCKWPLTRPA